MSASNTHPNRPATQDLSGVCILVLDDDPNMRSLVRGTLTRHGCQAVLQTGDGRDALRLFSTRTIDLVLCDWIMDPMPGLDFLRELRRPERGINVPVIMLTAISDPRDMLLAQPFRIGGWLVKPIAPAQLMERIGAVLKVPERSMTLEQDLSGAVEQVAIRYRAKLTDDLREIDEMLKLMDAQVRLPETPQAVMEILDGRRVLIKPGVATNGDLLRGWRTIERVMHGIKGQAGSFGYDLITSIAELGQRLMRSIDHDPRVIHKNGPELHKCLTTLIQSIRLVLQKEIRGDGGIAGQRLMEKLRLYTGQVEAALTREPEVTQPEQQFVRQRLRDFAVPGSRGG